MCGLPLLHDLFADCQTRHRGDGQQDSNHHPPHGVISPRLPHHLSLRRRPVLLRRQRPDLQPLQQRRQLPALWSGIPDRRTIRQQQFRPAAPGFLLLAGQPFPQRRHEIIVRQLVVFLSRLGLGQGIVGPFLAFRVGRRDEADFAVENAEQIIEVPGTTGVARRFQQFRTGAHVALDVGAGFGQ